MYGNYADGRQQLPGMATSVKGPATRAVMEQDKNKHRTITAKSITKNL
jgi:hypothetical protein